MNTDETIVHDELTDFAHYQVIDCTYEGRPARVLFAGEQRAGQSGIARDDDPSLLFDYNQRFLELAYSLDDVHRVLIIGGGAFTLPMALLKALPDVHVDVVEIDPALERIARAHFGLWDEPRLHIISGDGRRYIDGYDGAPYDMVIVDAFSEYHIPRPLLTAEAAAQYKRLLCTDGVLSVNFIAGYRSRIDPLSRHIQATFASVFRSVDVYAAATLLFPVARQNLLLIAYSSDRRHFNALATRREAPLSVSWADIQRDNDAST